MYCNKCGKLKSECICNNNLNANNSSKGPIIATVIVLTIVLAIVVVGLLVFSGSSKISNSKPKKYDVKDKLKIGKKYYSNEDDESYILFENDESFTAKRNYCSGFENVSGTYEIDMPSDYLILKFNTSHGDGESLEDYFEIGDDSLEYKYGDEYMTTCTGPFFKLK